MIPFVVVIIVGILVSVASIVIDAPHQSEFELERRKRSGDANAEQLLLRRQYTPDLISLQRTILSLLLVAMSALCVAAWGWIIGLCLAAVIALQYGAVARIGFLHQRLQNFYNNVEPKIIETIRRYPFIATVVRTVTTTASDGTLESRDELLHLVSQSGVVLSADEKALIHHGLQFSSRTVQEIMTPRSVIDSIGKNELLNPLVLDQLHKTGHSRIPVIQGDIDHIVGILYVHDLLTIDSSKRHTSKVETAMDPKVYYINHTQTLGHALAAFLRTQHHLFVVVNEYRETVGLLSLEDTVEALIGKKIVDEFDAHDDLRVVAARNPHDNNHHKTGHDV